MKAIINFDLNKMQRSIFPTWILVQLMSECEGHFDLALLVHVSRSFIKPKESRRIYLLCVSAVPFCVHIILNEEDYGALIGSRPST